MGHLTWPKGIKASHAITVANHLTLREEAHPDGPNLITGTLESGRKARRARVIQCENSNLHGWL